MCCHTTLKLPEGSVLASEIKKNGESLSAVYPTPDRIYSDGKRIILYWATKELGSEHSFRVFAMYTDTKGSYTFVIWLVLGLLIGAAIVYFKLGYRHEKVTRMLLSRDEEEIYNLIVASGGEILQEDIVRETGYSKAKVSKLVRNLEAKRIIKKEPYKKTNRLLLKKEFGGRY